MAVSTSKKSGLVLVHVAAGVATVMGRGGLAAIAAVTYVAVYHLLTPPRAA